MSYIKGQKYSSLKKQALKNGQLFRDPEFPAHNKSLFHSKVDKDIVWMRPGELCKVPKLVVEGVSADDFNEGELGNTWFVSACSALVKEQKLFNKVIPDIKTQEWDDKNEYAGIFKFNFWRYGKWIEVVVDDLLPTRDDKLIFCHSKSRNEFWSALLEKAYAKLYGDYESLKYGFTADALVDFTGGIPEKMYFKEMDTDNIDTVHSFFDQLRESIENRALINVSIQCSGSDIGQEANNGLIKGHGYIVTDARIIKVARQLQESLGGGELRLVRLRNPWGTKEWTGDWSDESPQWQKLTVNDRKKMGLKFEQEGEFWMSVKDMVDNFTNLEVLHFVNTSFFSLKKTWNETLIHKSWSAGARGSKEYRAGGNIVNRDTFLENPQVLFDVTGISDTFMFALEQDDSSIDKSMGQNFLSIGIVILKTENNRRFRLHEIGEEIAVSEYKESRSIFLKCKLPTGRYVAFPTTEKPNQYSNFLLRVYCGSSKANVHVLDQDCPKSSLCSKPYVMVTRVVIKKATDLQCKEGVKSMDAFVLIKCEGETVRTHTAPGNKNPVWEFRAIFYRKKIQEKPITFEIVNSNLIKDDFVGLATLQDNGSERPAEQELELFGKGKEAEVQQSGKLFVEITSSDDLTTF